MQGGFIGVDIFFVISGYLITLIIMKEVAAGNFSILAFYERRARRILPALYVLILLLIPISWYRLMPDDLENFGQSIVATTLFSNNILLFLTSGYWDLSSEFKPLLHTWSLGVEEQFYFALPLLFLVFGASLRSSLFIIGVIFFGSIALNIFNFIPDGKTTFYLPHYRFWELAAGSLCALLSRKGFAIRSSRLPDLALVTLFGCFGLLRAPDSVSQWALTSVAVLATSVIILADFDGKKSISSIILRFKPIVFIGLLSYSIYLYHQPLFAFARTWSHEHPGVPVFLGPSSFRVEPNSHNDSWSSSPVGMCAGRWSACAHVHRAGLSRRMSPWALP